jgi:ABC-2 type transport system ATP-binding protein
VAIIHQGRLVANGSLDELRAGVSAGISERGEKLTLEEMFLRIVGGSSAESTEEALQELSWLT